MSLTAGEEVGQFQIQRALPVVAVAVAAAAAGCSRRRIGNIGQNLAAALVA